MLTNFFIKSRAFFELYSKKIAASESMFWKTQQIQAQELKVEKEILLCHLQTSKLQTKSLTMTPE